MREPTHAAGPPTPVVTCTRRRRSASRGNGRLLLFLVAAVSACTSRPAPSQPAARPVAWVAVQPARNTDRLEVPARTVPGPGGTSMVTPPLRAVVTQVRVRAGDVVDAGAPLVDVVMPEVLEAAGRFQGARARLGAWTERLQNLQTLRADGLARSLDVSEAASRVAEAKADEQAARALLLLAGVTEAQVPRMLAGSGSLALHAPVAGVVTAVNAAVGESRDPTAGPLVRLSSASAVRVEARFARPVDDQGYDFVSTSGRTPLRLLARAPTADPLDGTFLAWFEPDAALIAGLLGHLEARDEGAPTQFVVPAGAISRSDSQARVETRRGVVNVEVVRCEGASCTVRGPLSATDEVQAP